MKRIMVLGLLLSTVLITGCYDDINRSQSDMNLVAEYIANVLEDKEYIPEKTTQEQSTQGATEGPTQGSTQKPTETPTQKPTQPGIDNPTEEPTSGSTQEPTTSAGGELGDTFEKTLGLTNVSIKNTNVVITKVYMESNGIVSTEASDGKKLIVLEFELKNTSNNTIVVNTKDVDTSYKLILNDGKTHVMRMATGLNLELLNSRDKTLTAGQTITTIMAFQTDEAIADNINKIELCCYSGEERLIINIR